MQKIEFERLEAIEIIQEDHSDFVIEQEELVASERWTLEYECIVKRLSDGTYWRTYYSVGATEIQEVSPFEYEKEVTFTRVEQVEIKSIEWVEFEE